MNWFWAFLTENRKSVDDPAGMQAFKARNPEELAKSIMGQLLFGWEVKAEDPQEYCFSGLIEQSIKQGAYPVKWHIEYLTVYWFLKVQGLDGRPVYKTECRVVVDEWTPLNKLNQERDVDLAKQEQERLQAEGDAEREAQGKAEWEAEQAQAAEDEWKQGSSEPTEEPPY